jgi:hypothetical protein
VVSFGDQSFRDCGRGDYDETCGDEAKRKHRLPRPVDDDLRPSGVLVTQIAIFLQSLVDDAFEFGGSFGIQADGRGGRGIKDGFEDDGGTFSAKRSVPVAIS